MGAWMSHLRTSCIQLLCCHQAFLLTRLHYFCNASLRLRSQPDRPYYMISFLSPYMNLYAACRQHLYSPIAISVKCLYNTRALVSLLCIYNGKCKGTSTLALKKQAEQSPASYTVCYFSVTPYFLLNISTRPRALEAFCWPVKNE